MARRSWKFLNQPCSVQVNIKVSSKQNVGINTNEEINMAKPLSAAQEAALAKGRATRARKLAEKKATQPATETPQPKPSPAAAPEPDRATSPAPDPTEPPQVPANPTTEQLMGMILEMQGKILELAKPRDPAEAIAETGRLSGGASIGMSGQQGVMTKWPVEKTYYPDPSDKLYDEPELRRFAMRENYIFKWNVQGVMYDFKGITYSEPRFEFELWRLPYEGEELPANFPKNGRIFVKRIYLHEDELAVRQAASKLGLDFSQDEQGFREMMNEMRYRFIRDWLVAVFKRPKLSAAGKTQQSMAIGGTVLEVEEGDSLTDPGAGAAQAAQIAAETELTPAEIAALNEQRAALHG